MCSRLFHGLSAFVRVFFLSFVIDFCPTAVLMTNAAHHQSRFRLNSYILEYCIRVPFSDRYCLENSRLFFVCFQIHIFFPIYCFIYSFCQSWTSISFWKCARGVYQRDFTAYCHCGIGKSEHSGSLKNEKGMGLLNCDICTQFTGVQNFRTRVDNGATSMKIPIRFCFCFCFVFIGVKYN